MFTFRGVIACTFFLAATIVNADDENKVSVCVFNNLNENEEHSWNLEFEGYKGQGDNQMSSEGRRFYCGN